MQSYKKAYESSQCVENRKPIHNGKLNMPMRQECILCCTVKDKHNVTSMVQIGNLEIDGFERRMSRVRYPIVQKGYDQYSFDVKMHRNIGLLSEFD